MTVMHKINQWRHLLSRDHPGKDNHSFGYPVDEQVVHR